MRAPDEDAPRSLRARNGAGCRVPQAREILAEIVAAIDRIRIRDDRRPRSPIRRNAARRAVRPHVLGELTCGFTGGERGIATGANGIAHRMESIVICKMPWP